MTMLDRMRRHRNWLKWSLALVVLAFIFFYVPDFLGSPGSQSDQQGPRQMLAEVDGHAITLDQYQRAYFAQVQAYRNAYGANVNEQLLKQLGIGQQILQQLVDEQAALAEARRLGLSATDTEVRERIVRLPAFQENGQFIGEQRYRQLLQMGNPPVAPAEFEENVRRGILLEKLRMAVTDWMTVSDADVEREFRRRNEKVKLQVVALPADRFREGIVPADAELATYFESHKEDFRIGEKRKIRFIPIDVQALRERVAVSQADIERSYNDNLDQYTTPAQIRASHILLKTEGKDEAVVRAQAEKILAEARSGGDFAALAKQYSEDEGSKENGGDLDFFGQGRMVPEFEKVAFALEPGALSDLVKTQYGFHIIKVTDRRAASERPLAEVRDQITEQIKWERAQQQASDIAAALAAEIKSPADMEKAAGPRGLTVKESGFFLRDEPIAGLGPSPEVAAEAFTLKEGDVSPAIRSAQGYAVISVSGTEASKLPTLDQVKDQVREAVVRQKALEAARASAGTLVAALKAAPDFAAAAKQAGFEAKTTELIARGTALPDVGVSQAVEAVAFSLPAGSVSDPIAAETAAVIVKVDERREVTKEEIAAGVQTLRTTLLNERRGRFFSSYMVKAKQRMNIRIDREAVARLFT